MNRRRPALLRGRHFEDVIILLCVRWYLRYSLTYRDLEEIMAERNLSVDHVTIWRWVQGYAPILNQRIRREKRRPNGSWRVDETDAVAFIGAFQVRAATPVQFRLVDLHLAPDATGVDEQTTFQRHLGHMRK
jgi:hypothetical protein